MWHFQVQGEFGTGLCEAIENHTVSLWSPVEICRTFIEIVVAQRISHRVSETVAVIMIAPIISHTNLAEPVSYCTMSLKDVCNIR